MSSDTGTPAPRRPQPSGAPSGTQSGARSGESFGAGAPAPRGPARWQWMVSGASIGGAVAVDVLANQVANLRWATWPALGLAALWLVVLAVRYSRSRRRRDLARFEPAPAVAATPAGSTSLPYTTGFTGRRDDLDWIRQALGTEHAVAVVGRRGVGTSSCAVEAANAARDTFPNGQIYLDLRPRGRRMSTRAVLSALARAVSAAEPESSRPLALADAATAIRDRLDDRDVLLLLDNVDDPAQLGALLPPTTRCRLLMAGTPALASVDGVTARWLEEPSQAEAVELFASAAQAAPGASARRTDPRTDPAVKEIVELCGRQPRTVRALGYRMARHGWRPDDLRSTLRYAASAPVHQRVPLSEVLILLADGDVAYAALSRPARRLFRLLSLAPRALDRPAIAELGRVSPRRLARLLNELANGAFVIGAPGDRYEIRPPLVGYARLHHRRGDPVSTGIAASVRLLRHLARDAERHAVALAVTGTRSSGTGLPPALPLADDPFGWFERRADLLCDVVEDTPGEPGTTDVPLPRRVRRWWLRLAVALCGWYAQQNLLDEWSAVCRSVLAAPTAGGRREVAAWAHNELGVIHRRAGQPNAAVDEFQVAIQRRGRRGAAQARMNLGLAMLDLGQVDEAIEQLERARRHRARADRSGHAHTSLAFGAAHLRRGDPELAIGHLVRAANTFRAVGESRGYAAALTDLALAQAWLGEHLDAAQSWTAALREYDIVSDRPGQAIALLNAGAAVLAANPARAATARELLERGRDLRDPAQPSAGLARTLLYLGDATALLGDPEAAHRHWLDTVRVGEQAGDREGVAAARRRLAAPR